jgi:hypothetical protein
MGKNRLSALFAIISLLLGSVIFAGCGGGGGGSDSSSSSSSTTNNSTESTVNVAGTWKGTINFTWNNYAPTSDNPTINLNQTGTTVSGTFASSDGTLNVTGTVSGSTLTINLVMPSNGGNLTLIHNVSGTTMTATSASGWATPGTGNVSNITGYSGTLIKQ